jgi:UTP--glucose-1-phosphate uridylyltransferase
MKKRITVAVFPVAGLGTRFLPITKTGPKEMLPLVDKPIIQYVVEEALGAGIEQLIFVTSNSKYAIEDYFDRHYEFESILRKKEKKSELALIQDILPKHINVAYIRQPEPIGLGDAVLRAKSVVGEQPFAVLLPDDIIDCPPDGCLKSMVDMFEKMQESIVAVEQIPLEDSTQYGVVALSKQNPLEITDIIEKPKPANAPSRLAVVGRYILTPQIFTLLEQTECGVGGEIQLTDAISKLLNTEHVFAFPFKGKRYDCGSKLGLLEATIAFALKRPDLSADLAIILEKLLIKHTEKDPLTETE